MGEENGQIKYRIRKIEMFSKYRSKFCTHVRGSGNVLQRSLTIICEPGHVSDMEHSKKETCTKIQSCVFGGGKS